MAFSSALDPRRESWMSLKVCTLSGPESKSFEEVRIEDYLKAYSTTGRPPAPCPQYPISSGERAALNLPPLFEPYSSLDGVSPSTKGAVGDLSDLPASQVFQPTREQDETFQSISAVLEYSKFSPEELRYNAYSKGNKSSPTPITYENFLPDSVASASTTRYGQSKPAELANNDTLLTITAKPEYAQHSLEELRLSYIKSGSEMTSAEILGGTPVVPQATSLLSSASSSGGAFSFSGPGAFSRPVARPF